MQFTEGTVPAVRAERPFEPPHAESWQQFFEKADRYLKVPIGALGQTQMWTGQNTFAVGADISFDKAAINDNAVPSVMPNAVKVSRVVGPGAKETQGSALSVIARSEAGTRQQTWNIFSFVDDYSAPIGESAFTKAFTGAVGVYSKAYKRSIAPIWGGVFEAQNYNETTDEGQMYGIEVSIQSERLDPNNYWRGIAIFYGSRSGGASRHWAGLDIEPFGNQATAELGFGVLVNGKMSNAAFGSGTTGPTMLYGAGQYSDAAIKISDATNTPYAIDMGGGSRMRFRSGTASGTGAQTWYSGFPALTFIGVLEIVVDNTVLYLPVSSTK